MMIKETIWMLLIVFLCVQCDSKPVVYNYDWEGKEQYLKDPTVLRFDTCLTLEVNAPPVFLEPDLVVLSQSRQPEFLTAYKLSNDSLLYKNVVIRKGEGPNEVLRCPTICQLDNGKYVILTEDWTPEVFISDTSSPDALSDLSTWEKYKLPNSICVSSIAPVLSNENQFYGGMHADSTMFFQYSLNDTMLTPIYCEYPASSLKVPNNTDYSYLYRGLVSKHPYKNLFFYSCHQGLYSYTFNIEQGRVNILDVLYNELPQFNLKEGVFSFTSDPENPNGPLFAIDDKYIYMLDRSHSSLKKMQNREVFENKYPIWCSKTIYVFSWEGEPIKKLTLDHPIEMFNIHNNCIYATAYSEDLTDHLILRYSL